MANQRIIYEWKVQLFVYLEIVHAFLSSDFFQILVFLNSLTGIPSVSNSLDPYQARHFVRPNLGPNCLEK